MLKSALSTKGQVVIPKSIRDRHDWHAGTKFEFIDYPDGVLMKAVPASPKKYTLDDLASFLKYDGPPATIDDMKRAIDDTMDAKWSKRFGRREPG